MKKFLLSVFAVVFGLGISGSLISCSEETGEETTPPGESFTCVEQIIDGCVDIATEVGESKIGDPLGLFLEGKEHEALLAVESWYSFHSREDYSNNIRSIRNAYYGTRNGEIAPQSLATLIAANNPTLDKQVKDAIQEAIEAILDIPNPFRNNIDSNEARTAQQKCADLVETLTALKTYMSNTEAVNQDEVLDPIVANYVDNVVLPTYKDLRDKNAELYDVVSTFQANPSNENFQTVANKWLEAREPWETSEAFLFGPVDAEGLDPNMDSWPLDAPTIVSILNSGNFDNLDWSDEDSDEAIEAKQGVRGFHTLEFLTFRNGVARTLSDVAESDNQEDIVYNSTNAASWGNYMKQVAYLLKKDANDLYEYWNTSYHGSTSFADQFKSHEF